MNFFQKQGPYLISVLGRPSPMVAQQYRSMGYASRYVGPNNMIRQERQQMRKYGMRRHFYDKLHFKDQAMPTTQ